MENPSTVAGAVLAHVMDALAAGGSEDISTAYVAAGMAVWDDCCGQLVVAPERVYRTVAPFPSEAGADERCADTPIAVDLVVLLLRCVPTLSDAGAVPSTEELDARYQVILRDAALVWNAVVSRDLLGDDGYGDPLWDRARVSQTWVGANGACIGTETRLTLGVPSAVWCTSPEPGDV